MRKLRKPKGRRRLYDISAVHGRYSRDAMAANVGHKAVIFSMLRHPVDQFLSFWKFFFMSEKFNNATVDEWLLG
jgi:hypothetical protein